jgi:hypothetical protein
MPATDLRSSSRVRARLAAADESSARVRARPAEVVGPSALLGSLFGDPLRAVARLLADADRFRLRLTCKTAREHCDPPVSPAMSRVAFLCTRSLATYACDELPDFVLADKTRMLALAAQVGRVAVLAELMDVRGWTGHYRVDACRAAAAHGQLEALVWLRGRGCSWDASVCDAAAGGGHLELLRYAREQGCPWHSGTCYSAARGGHLEALRYAREQGCPWDYRTCSSAAGGGHLEGTRVSGHLKTTLKN